MFIYIDNDMIFVSFSVCLFPIIIAVISDLENPHIQMLIHFGMFVLSEVTAWLPITISLKFVPNREEDFRNFSLNFVLISINVSYTIINSLQHINWIYGDRCVSKTRNCVLTSEPKNRFYVLPFNLFQYNPYQFLCTAMMKATLYVLFTISITVLSIFFIYSPLVDRPYIIKIIIILITYSEFYLQFSMTKKVQTNVSSYRFVVLFLLVQYKARFKEN